MQDFGLINEDTVYENVALPLLLGDFKMKNIKAENIMSILLKLNKTGKTVIIVTHDDDIANQCKKTINIVDGIIN